MKLFFRLLAIASICIYFYFPNNIQTSKEDQILNKILEIKNKDKIESIIVDDKIIIGTNGKKVNIKKSYINMIKENKFIQKNLIYDIEQVLISKDYKIIGKKTNDKIISIIIYLNNNDKKINIPTLSYFASSSWYQKYKINIDGVSEFNEEDLAWLSYKVNYCLTSSLICNKYNLFTIEKEIIKDNFYAIVKENLKPGEIFVFDLNNDLKKEINLIVNYVKSKGYEIKNIENLLNT